MQEAGDEGNKGLSSPADLCQVHCHAGGVDKGTDLSGSRQNTEAAVQTFHLPALWYSLNKHFKPPNAF